MDIEGVPPWHMWGSDATVQLPRGNGTISLVQSSSQLARIRYKRPDSWSFLFWAVLLNGDTTGGDQSVECHFDISVGVGRSSVTIPDFCVLRFAWTGVAQPPLNIPLFSSASPNQNSVASGFAPTTNGVMTDFPASDIQCSCRAIAGGTNDPATVQVAAYFAPKTHIRPDWYGAANEPLFSDERGGR